MAAVVARMTSEASSASAGSTRGKAPWLTQTLAEAKQLTAGPPVDYSFKDLKTVVDLVHEAPVSGCAHHPPVPREDSPLEYLDGIIGVDGESTSPSYGRSQSYSNRTSRSPAKHAAAPDLGAKLNSTSLRVCNNHLSSLKGLDRVVHHVLDDPTQLMWLDASSNQLATIEDVLLNFPNLQVLYLHGNAISSLHDVLKLSKLTKLTKLTLHGNPISEQRDYKLWVAAHLPNLRNLDFSAITRVERDKVQAWWRSHAKKSAQ